MGVGVNGTGVKVAVLDTGINHPLLNDRTTHFTCENASCVPLEDPSGIRHHDNMNRTSHGSTVAQAIASSSATYPGIATGGGSVQLP